MRHASKSTKPRRTRWPKPLPTRRRRARSPCLRATAHPHDARRNATRPRHGVCVNIDAHAEYVEDIMHHSIEPHELTKIDLARYQVVQVCDGTLTVVLWEEPEPDADDPPMLHTTTSTLTIRLCDPLNPMQRKDVCEQMQAHLATTRAKRSQDEIAA